MSKDKLKNFVKNYKINKSLLGYSEDLDKGDEIMMFNNRYKVMSQKGLKQVVLKDAKDLMIAIPDNKIRFLMKKGIVKRLVKSNGQAKVLTPQGFIQERKQVTPRSQERAVSATGVKGVGSRGGKVVGYRPNGQPIYESQMSQGGRHYVPSKDKWVDLQSGKSYDDHTTPDDQHHHHLKDDPEALKEMHKLERRLFTGVPEDTSKDLKNLLNDHFERAHEYNNMFRALNAMKDVPTAFHDKLDKLNQEVRNSREKFKKAYLEKVRNVKKV